MADSRPVGAKPTVLVVDDEPLVARTHARVLRPHCEVAVCTGAGAAREALDRVVRGERYDVVLCDLQMPELDGFGLVAQCRTHWPDVALHCVFVSGGINEAERAAALAQGIRCLLKPATTEELLAAVRGDPPR
jgi:CheY-like chemotaxis protein